jgi:hypothetical protein
VALLKCYAVLLACAAWLLAPPLFNPTDREGGSQQQRRDRLKLQLRVVWQWLQADASPSGGGGSNSSWEQWAWEDKFRNLQLRALRSHMQAGRGRRQRWLHHPWLLCLLAVAARLLSWLPWLFLSLTLLSASTSALPALLVYLCLLALLHASPLPRALRFAAVCTGTILYSAATHMQELQANIRNRVRHKHTEQTGAEKRGSDEQRRRQRKGKRRRGMLPCFL